MMHHGSVQVVRRWCGVHNDPVCGCFNNPEGLNNGYLPSGRDPRIHKLGNGLRLSTTVSS
jgi:hypothetical protein